MTQTESQSLLKKVLSKMKWKYLLVLIVPTLVWYPKLLMLLIHPLKKKWIRSYQQIHEGQKYPHMILLTTNKDINQKNIPHFGKYDQINSHNNFLPLTKQLKRCLQNCLYLDYNIIDGNDALWVEIINLRVKTISFEPMSKIPLCVCIKSNQNVLKMFQAKFYGLKYNDTYKLGNYTPNKMHLLIYNHKLNTYEQNIIEIQFRHH